MNTKKLAKFILALYIVHLHLVPALAQSISLPFERLSVEDGLPNPSVMSIMQDDQGFIWLGTFSGVSRYDGYQLKNYRPGDGIADAIAIRDFPCLYQDREKRLWLGLANQQCNLYKYNPAHDRFLPFRADLSEEEKALLSSYAIMAMIQDKHGRLLAGTDKGGLLSVTFAEEGGDSVNIVQYLNGTNDPHLLPGNSITGDMSEDQHGNIWIPTEAGLYKWLPDREQYIPFPGFSNTGSRKHHCFTTLFDPPHTIWAGTELEGLLKIDTRDDTYMQYQYNPDDPYSINNAGIYDLAKSKDGLLWMTSFDLPFLELQQLDIASGRFYTVRDRSDTSRWAILNDLYVDHADNLWTGSWQVGAFKYSPQRGQFQFLRFPSDGYYGRTVPILSIEEDAYGNLWLGTSRKGLAAWDRRSEVFSQVIRPEAFPEWLNGNVIYSIGEFAPGQFLLGTEEGVLRFDANSKQMARVPTFDTASFTTLYPSSGNYWWGIDFRNGVFTLDLTTGIFQAVLKEHSLITLEEGTGGALLLGENQLGLHRYFPNTQKHKRYLERNGIHDIQLDRNGVAWLSTHSDGLKAFDFESESEIPLSDEVRETIGLCRQILMDKKGLLWINTARGIVHFDPYKHILLRYFKASRWLEPGMPWFAPFQEGNILKDGTLAFGSASGALLFHPDSLTTDTTMPKVALTEFQLFNKAITPGPDSPLNLDIAYAEQINLDHDQNDIALTFAALLFKSTESLRYRYRLLPQEKEWIEAGTRNKAFYTALPPGRYHFEVQAANLAGEWHEKEASVDIIIRRPWWDSWPARSFYLLILGLIGLGIYRFLSQRVETRRLRELDALKSRLYTNISHEFRTPLTLILGQADRLKSYIEATARPGLNMIERNGQQLLRLVNQMLDLSRLDAGKLKLELIQADVIPFLNYVLDSFQSLAQQRGVGLTFTSNLESLPMDFDPGYLQQVLANLLSNALKFTPAGGNVKLEVRGEPGKTLALMVKDTGKGVAQEEATNIFDRFYQADGTSTRSAEGAGIGLAVTRELVQLMGGTIAVGSELGVGSVFTVQLPITRKAPVKEPVPSVLPVQEEVSDEPLFEESKAPRQNGQPCVLIVEDNAEVRTYLRECLYGIYRVEAARNGKEGIEKARAIVPDIVVSDVMMPEMDGFEFCKRLKKDKFTSHIPIILLTARADLGSRLEGLELGAEAYLAKPFYKKELLIRVRKLLEIRQQLKSVYQKWITEPPQEKTKRHDLDQEFIIDARNIVLENLPEVAFSVPEFAKALGVSRTQLHRKLTQLTGYSASHFIRLIRMQRAKEMLRSTQETVASIAYQCGFSDPNYFSKIFKQEERVTPTAFRRQKH